MTPATIIGGEARINARGQMTRIEELEAAEVERQYEFTEAVLWLGSEAGRRPRPGEG